MATDIEQVRARREKRIWVIYKADSGNAQGWEERLLMPSGHLTSILREASHYSGGKNLPKTGDQVVEFSSGQWRKSDWVISEVKHFSSDETEEKIVVCYCEYQPIQSEWHEVKRGKPVSEMLAALSEG